MRQRNNIIEIRYYQTRDGKKPFIEWLDSLKDQKVALKIEKRIDHIKKGNLGDHKGANGIMELRIHYGPGYRLYCGMKGKTVIIMLCGGDKSAQKKDIKTAKEYWNDYNS